MRLEVYSDGLIPPRRTSTKPSDTSSSVILCDSPEPEIKKQLYSK